MKNYFAINQNPDAKDLKQLAQKTGLSKRVLQVWDLPFAWSVYEETIIADDHFFSDDFLCKSIRMQN